MSWSFQQIHQKNMQAKMSCQLWKSVRRHTHLAKYILCTLLLGVPRAESQYHLDLKSRGFSNFPRKIWTSWTIPKLSKRNCQVSEAAPSVKTSSQSSTHTYPLWMESILESTSETGRTGASMGKSHGKSNGFTVGNPGCQWLPYVKMVS